MELIRTDPCIELEAGQKTSFLALFTFFFSEQLRIICRLFQKRSNGNKINHSHLSYNLSYISEIVLLRVDCRAQATSVHHGPSDVLH